MFFDQFFLNDFEKKHIIFIICIEELIPSVSSNKVYCWCLGNIAGDSAQFRDHLLFAGILKPIIQIVSSNPKISILRNSAWCLSNLCRGKPR